MNAVALPIVLFENQQSQKNYYKKINQEMTS